MPIGVAAAFSATVSDGENTTGGVAGSEAVTATATLLLAVAPPAPVMV